MVLSYAAYVPWRAAGGGVGVNNPRAANGPRRGSSSETWTDERRDIILVPHI